MPSPKSKSTGTRNSRSVVAHTYFETELRLLADELSAEVRARGRDVRPRIILKGVVGAGKSTLARAVLEALGIRREAEGSPTFAIAHEYLSAEGFRVVHADGYRLKSEEELEATGLLEALWDPKLVVLFEWLELFPETEHSLRESPLHTIWIHLEFCENPSQRRIEISRTGHKG